VTARQGTIVGERECSRSAAGLAELGDWAPSSSALKSIVGIQPPVTRTLELPIDLNLAQHHEVLQATFGWTDSHPH
jgi:hypothetical protein